VTRQASRRQGHLDHGKMVHVDRLLRTGPLNGWTLRWLLRHVPQGILARPFEMWISVLCIIGGVPLVAGVPAPSSVDALLPGWMVRWWGTMLIVGALLVAAGLFRPRSHPERLGHSLLGPAAVTYALSIVTVVGWSGALAAAIIFGFGLACLTRAAVLAAAERLIAEAAWRELHSGPEL
jgi:hypothetical protein